MPLCTLCWNTMSVTHNYIVMGPAKDSMWTLTRGAPQLTADTEKLKYRKSVPIWAQRVRVIANGGLNISRGIASNLCHTLYSTETTLLNTPRGLFKQRKLRLMHCLGSRHMLRKQAFIDHFRTCKAGKLHNVLLILVFGIPSLSITTVEVDYSQTQGAVLDMF